MISSPRHAMKRCALKVSLCIAVLVQSFISSDACAASSSLQHPMGGASATGAPGEAGLLFLLDDAVYFHPLNNDVAGKTDKFLTHSMRLGVTKRWDNESLDFRSGWRFITPSYDIVNGVSVRPPIGAYGDWAEFQLAYSVLFEEVSLVGAIPRVQLEAGLGHLGPKGAHEIQVDFHKEIHNSWEHLTWADQRRGMTSSAGFEFGLASHVMEWGSLKVATYGGALFHASPVMVQYAGKASLVMRTEKDFGVAVEGRVVRQIESLIFPDLAAYRAEVAVGVLLSRWYKPTLTWVGPYYLGDDTSQVFVDVVNVNWPF